MSFQARGLAKLLLCGVLTLSSAAALAQTVAPGARAPQNSQAGILWKQLGARERQALAPLAEHWADISEPQRSKWLTIARNFDQLPATEQQLMQARMKEWVALSPVQRNQARLNFNSVQNVSKDQKKSRWDEYQNLSEEEKRKLSASTLAASRTAAPSARPASSDRLVQPAVRTVPPAALPARAPIDRHTLLPVPPTPAAAAPSDPPATQDASETPGASAAETPNS